MKSPKKRSDALNAEDSKRNEKENPNVGNTFLFFAITARRK